MRCKTAPTAISRCEKPADRERGVWLTFLALQKNLWVIQWGFPTSFDDGVIWMTLPMMNPARGIFSDVDSCVQ